MNSTKRQFVGTVRSLYRYPVKSMQAEPLPEAHIDWYGFEGDRRYSFVKDESMSGFPWLTGREVPEMVLFTARYTDPAKWAESKVMVTLPDGRELQLDSPDMLQVMVSAYGRGAHLMYLSRGCYDEMPVSLISVGSLDGLASQVGHDLDARRFRPNILADLADPSAFAEDRWIDHLIQVGDAEDAPLLRMSTQNIRCAMPNIDPNTAERNPQVLKTVVLTRNKRAGLYGSVQRMGRVCEGDPIYLITES